MKRLGRQAAGLLGRALHALGLILLTGVSLLGIAVFVLAFRLSMGPIKSPYLATKLANAVSGQGIVIHVSEAALAWGGYRQGGAAPLYLKLGNITAANAAGVALAVVPDARLVFLPGALFGTRAPILVNSADAHFAGSDVGVSMLAAIRLGLGFRLSSADLFITLGGGRLGAGGMSLPITGGGFLVHLTPMDVALDNGSLTLAPSGASAPVVTFSGKGRKQGDWQGEMTVMADQVQAPDIGAYWPPALAAQTRHWVTSNITAGTARNAKFTFGLQAPPDLSQVSLASETGGFSGAGLTLNWIPGAVPITNLDGMLSAASPNAMTITARSARLGGLTLHDGTMVITGITTPDQTANVTAKLDGSVQDAIAVLNAPPLALLRAAPPDLAKATGGVAATVTATLPLKTEVKLAAVDLAVEARLDNVAVPTPLAGLGFTKGAVHLRATGNGLQADGTAQFAGEPATVSAVADFHAAQVLRGFTMKTSLGAAVLHQYGLDAATQMTDAVTGTVPIDLAITAAGDTQTAALTADLSNAGLGVPVFGWSKAAGAAGRLSVNATLVNGGIGAVTALSAQAPGLDIDGVAKAGTLDFTHADIGETVAQGRLTPAGGGQPWRLDFSGPALSLRAILKPAGKAQAKAEAAATPGAAAPAGPAWAATFRFTSFRLAKAPAPRLRNFSFTGSGEGGTLLTANVHAATGPGLPVTLVIAPGPGRRRNVHLATPDGGELLRVIGAYDDLQGGALVLDAQYGDLQPVNGTLSVDQFRVLQAPAIGKILQGLTIYGVAEATSGPGLEFDRLVAPFSIAAGRLTLRNARAFSTSLGFTASGDIALADGSCDIATTIIPAYAINALPGKIPVIGKLFSAEKGGGLFAVRARITGRLADPDVSVNPLSALTPGVLRDVFGGGRN